MRNGVERSLLRLRFRVRCEASLEQFDISAAGGLVADAGEVQLLVMADDSILDRAQALQLHASGVREINYLARLGAPHVLRGDPVALELYEALDELDVA